MIDEHTHETLQSRIDDLPGLINILRADPNEWHDYRIQLPETSMIYSLERHLIGIEGAPHEAYTSAIWQWSIKWVSLPRIQIILHGKDDRYNQPTPRLRVIAFLESLWLGLEPNSEAEIDRAIKGINRS